jgi:hypothetical protein
MAAEKVLRTGVELAASLEILAALAAHLRIEAEGLSVDDETREVLADVAAELGVVEAPSPPTARAVIGLTRMILAQSAALVANPSRPVSWDHDDPMILQGTGAVSAPIAQVIAGVAPSLDGLAERLAAPGAAILDIGTGVGSLAIAFAQAFPGARVVGIDIHEPALELARRNVADSPVGDRVEIRCQDATELAGDERFDLVWVPLPFIPLDVMPSVLLGARRAVQPGGWLITGRFGGPPNRLGELLSDLRALRSGGHVWEHHELVEAIADVGIPGAVEIPRDWDVPVRLVVGRAGLG